MQPEYIFSESLFEKSVNLSDDQLTRASVRYLETFGQCLKNIETNIKSHNTAQAKQALNKLKLASIQLNLTQAINLLDDIEENLLEGTHSKKIPELLQDLNLVYMCTKAEAHSRFLIEGAS